MKGGTVLTAVHDTNEPEEYVLTKRKINELGDSFYFATQIIKKKKEGKKLLIWINFKSRKPPTYFQKFMTQKIESAKKMVEYAKSGIPTMQTQNQIDNSYVNKLTLGDLNTHIGQQMGMRGGLFNLGATDSTFKFKSKLFNVKLEEYYSINQTGALTLSSSDDYTSRDRFKFNVAFYFEGQKITIFIKITNPITQSTTNSPKEKEFSITVIKNKIEKMTDHVNIEIYKVKEYMEVDILTKEEELTKQRERNRELIAKPIF